MSSFKVGDTVHLKERSCGVKAGFIGRVQTYSDMYITVVGDSIGSFGHKGVQTYTVEIKYCEHYTPQKEVTMDQDFQVGDYVERINDGFGRFQVGDIGIIRKVETCNMWVAKIVNGVASDVENRGYSTSNFKKIPALGAAPSVFKLGDTVIAVRQSMSIAKDTAGVIIDIDMKDNTVNIKRHGACSCWLRMADCVITNPVPIQTNTAVWAEGTLLKTTGNSFGGGIGRFGYVTKYDWKDDTYRLRRYEDSSQFFWVRAKDCVLAEDRDVSALSPDSPVSTPTPTTTEKGTTMALSFKTVHYLNNNPVEQYNPEALVDIIANEEAAIEKLKRTKSVPKRVKTEIDRREQQLKDLVEFLDGQDATPSAG